MRYVTELRFKHTCSLEQFMELKESQLATLMKDALQLAINRRNRIFDDELEDDTPATNQKET